MASLLCSVDCDCDACGSFDTFSPSQFAPGDVGAPPSTVDGKWGYYAFFDQVIYQPYGKDDPHAMGIYASV